MAKRMFFAWLGWMVFVAPIALWWNLRDQTGDWPFVLVALFLAAGGRMTFRAAHRAWLNLELG